MSIQSIGAPPVRIADHPGGDAVIQPQPRVAATHLETAVAVEKAAPAPSQDEVKQAVASINKSLQTLSQDLVFSVDDKNRTIVKVVDQKTKEVIRQIPSPEALEIAKALDTAQGLLIKQTA
ncbi:MAG: flagellar protein FlaG [Pseudomonadota bacterium]